jgi:uncharacterized membrane protein
MTDQDAVAARLPESTRVEAFSDGVFAIALTLLVLDLHAPADHPGGLAAGLLAQWPAYVAYLAAFLNISAIWINHHDLFTRVRRVDPRLIYANLMLLLVTALFPWPASVISAAVQHGDRGDQSAAMVLYAAVGFLVPLAWNVLYHCVARSPQLLIDPAGVEYARRAARRSLVSIVVYPVAAVLAFVEPIAALAAFAALPMFFIGSLFFASAGPQRDG